MDLQNDHNEIDVIKTSLESFIEDCKAFNYSIDDSITQAEVLHGRYERIYSKFDDIYPLLSKIPNTLVACKLQLSMEALLDKAKRVFAIEVKPTLLRAQEIKKLDSRGSVQPTFNEQHCNLLNPNVSGRTSKFRSFKEDFDGTVHNSDLPYRQNMENHLKAHERLNDFFLLPGFHLVSSEEIRKYRKSISEAHLNLIELNLPDLGDYILFVFTYNRMPEMLKSKFIEAVKPCGFPTLQQLLEFLAEQETVLKTQEKLDSASSTGFNGEKCYDSGNAGSTSKSVGGGAIGNALPSSHKKPCRLYKEAHSLLKVDSFLPVGRDPVVDLTASEFGGSGAGEMKTLDGRSSSLSCRPPCLVCRGPHAMRDCSSFQTNDASSISFLDLGSQEKQNALQTSTSHGDSKPMSSSGSERSSKSNKTIMPCHFCHEPHSLRNCPTFLSLTVAERRSYMETFYQICRNCLSQSHNTSNCSSSLNCKLCSKRHHLFLHPEPVQQQKGRNRGVASADQEKNLRNIKRQFTMFRPVNSPSPVSSIDGFLLSSASSDEYEAMCAK
ncbi:hypothetical protein GE061_011368 [Apolygus lucorum]|uniref:Uncharacterized protein n=1 Tax=Apolygus lucorum TaxID=248454 RepID=A0A6A4K1R3_APOLU|nr:hypothetical protein GE061_011368 [Apolygus lucorum]